MEENMKKGFFVLLFLFMAVALTACGEAESKYYFASQTPTENSTWVSWVTIEKKGDKVVNAEWNAFHIEGDSHATYLGKDKVTASKEGIYNMNSDLWWHEQAELVIEKFIASNGDVNDRLPAPAGVSITTDDFYSLAELALASDPIEAGDYVDGYHFTTLKSSATSRNSATWWDPVKEVVVPSVTYQTYSFGSFLVVNGRIVMAYLNNVFYGYRAQLANGFVRTIDHDNDPETPNISLMAEYTSANARLYRTKNQLGKSYGMTGASPIGKDYHEQAFTAAAYLIENQQFPTPNQDGDFEGVAGVTITARDFHSLWQLIPTK